MKKFLKVTLIILGVIVLILVLDFSSILLKNKPIFAIRKGPPYKYVGLFYDTFACPEYPMAQIKMKGSKFLCAVTKEDFIIVDEVKVCDEALEEIYDDGVNKYYLSCIKSDNVYIKFDSGRKIKIRKALEDKTVTINDIINKGYSIIVEPLVNN